MLNELQITKCVCVDAPLSSVFLRLLAPQKFYVLCCIVLNVELYGFQDVCPSNNWILLFTIVELLKNVSYLFHVSIHVHKQHSDQYLYYNLFVYKPLHDFRDYAEKFKIFTVPTS